MANVTISDYKVTVTRKHAIKPDLTNDEVAAAIQSALITKMGYANTVPAIEAGDITITVEG